MLKVAADLHLGDAHHPLMDPFVTDPIDEQLAGFLADQGGNPFNSTSLGHRQLSGAVVVTMARSTRLRVMKPLIKAPIRATAVTGLLRR